MKKWKQPAIIDRQFRTLYTDAVGKWAALLIAGGF